MFDENDNEYWWNMNTSVQKKTGVTAIPGSPDYDYTKDDPYSPYYDPSEPAVNGGVNSSLFSQSYRGGLNATLKGPSGPSGPSVQEKTQAQPAVRSSSGGYARAYPIGTTSTTTSQNILPSGPTPSVSLPSFTAPEWDEAKIDELARKAAGPYVGGLRRGLNRTLVAIRSSEKNPVARAQMYRQAMEGFGGEQGLGGVLAQARRQGRAEYGQEYAYDYQEAVTNLTQRNQEALANFNSAMMIYQSKIKQQTTTSSKTSYSTTPSSESTGGSGEEMPAIRSLSGGMAYPGESMKTFINPKTPIGSRTFFS